MRTQTIKPSSKNLPEGLLIDLALAGNQHAYTVIFERHERMLRTVISRYLHQVEDVEECLQDTLVRMYRALPNFRRECKLSSWLYQIANFTAINYYRSKSHRYCVTSIETIPEYKDLQDSQPDAMVQIERDDTAHWVHTALQFLSEKEATVLKQFYLNEWSINEICEATGLTESNIKTRLSRARLKLREVVEQQFKLQLVN